MFRTLGLGSGGGNPGAGMVTVLVCASVVVAIPKKIASIKMNFFIMICLLNRNFGFNCGRLNSMISCFTYCTSSGTYCSFSHARGMLHHRRSGRNCWRRGYGLYRVFGFCLGRSVRCFLGYLCRSGGNCQQRGKC